MQKKILLIHEDPKVCDSLRQAFVSYGYAVVQLRKTDDAEALLAAELPDAIIVEPDLLKEDIKALVDKLNGRRSVTPFVAAAPLVIPAPIQASSPESAKAAAPNAEAAEKLKQFQNLFLVVKAKYARTLPQKVEELGRDIHSSQSQPGRRKLLRLCGRYLIKWLVLPGLTVTRSFRYTCERSSKRLSTLVSRPMKTLFVRCGRA